jgi:hypothetical protein
MAKDLLRMMEAYNALFEAGKIVPALSPNEEGSCRQRNAVSIDDEVPANVFDRDRAFLSTAWIAETSTGRWYLGRAE